MALMSDPQNPSDAIAPLKTTMPPQGKVWQVAGPIWLHSLSLLVGFAGVMTGHVSNEFFQKIIEWNFIGLIASATPKGVLDTIKAMTVGRE